MKKICKLQKICKLFLNPCLERMGILSAFDFIYNKKFQYWALTLLHIETLFIIAVIFFIIYFTWFARLEDVDVEKLKKDFMGVVNDAPESQPKRQKHKPKLNKHEERCREIFEEIFDAKFKSTRPNWLQNPVTKKNLELDGFAPNIKTKLGKGLAFEYDGAQHSQYNKHFHRGGPEEFIYQTKKDSWKDLRCKQEGVLLIRIPSFVAFQDLERYIKQKLTREGLI